MFAEGQNKLIASVLIFVITYILQLNLLICKIFIHKLLVLFTIYDLFVTV